MNKKKRLNREYVWQDGCRLVLGEETLIMGILNVTPDSFSDGGLYTDVERAVRHAERMAADGAHVIDIGGESTRPGHTPVSAAEEKERVLPVIAAVRERLPFVPISVDTNKAEVARAALAAGAHMINDIWGFRRDAEMARLAAEYQCPVVLMHNREKPEYADLLQEVKADLGESVEIALRAGVKEDRIWLDPGFGFGKTWEQNLYLMRHLDEIVDLGYPVLVGTSRKSMIWRTLGLKPTEVVEGTAATVTLAIWQGCHMVRVHDVREMRKAVRMTDAIRRAERQDGGGTWDGTGR